MKIDVSELYELQEKLDQYINEQHHTTYSETFNKRLLALIVEIGELSNETRCFKFWSLNKKTLKNKILEEYVDGLHFLLSIGIPLKPQKKIYQIKQNNKDLVLSILKVYNEAIKLKDHYCIEQYECLFSCYIDLITILDLTPEEVIIAYNNKLRINYDRQKNGY